MKTTIILNKEETECLRNHLGTLIAKGSISTSPSWARRVCGKIDMAKYESKKEEQKTVYELDVLRSWHDCSNEIAEFSENNHDNDLAIFSKGFSAGVKSEIKDKSVKILAVLDYCEDHLDKMWAAVICSTLLGCDFRDAKQHSQLFRQWFEENF